MKKVRAPIWATATGQTWPTIMDPMDPPEAAILKPFARTLAGKICVDFSQATYYSVGKELPQQHISMLQVQS